MTNVCKNLMLMAAVAAAAGGCAQDRARMTVVEINPEQGAAARAWAANREPDQSLAAEQTTKSKMAEDQILLADPRTDSGREAGGSEVVPAQAESDAQERISVPDVPPPGSQAPAPQQGGDPPRLTLAYLTDLAIENHPVLRRDRARIVSAEGDALQAGLYPNPHFDTNNPQVFNGANSLFNAGIMQEFVVKGKKRLERAAALRAVQQSEMSLVQDRYTLLTSVRSQFYTVVAAQARVEVLKRLLEVTKASLEQAQERFNAKIADQTEVLLVEIDYNRVKADLLNAEKVLAGERAQLEAIVGLPGLLKGPIDGSLTALPPTFDEEILRAFVTSDHALTQIAKLEIDKNKILLQRAEAEPYPNITLGPAYQWGLTKGNEQYWLTVTFPIPVSDRNQGNIKAARANIHDSVETLGTVQLELLRQVADAYSKYRGAIEQMDTYKSQIIPDSVEAMRLARSGYEAGVFEFAIFLQAQRTVMQTQREYVDLLENVWTTAATLAGLLQMDSFP